MAGGRVKRLLPADLKRKSLLLCPPHVPTSLGASWCSVVSHELAFSVCLCVSGLSVQQIHGLMDMCRQSFATCNCVLLLTVCVGCNRSLLSANSQLHGIAC